MLLSPSRARKVKPHLCHGGIGLGRVKARALHAGRAPHSHQHLSTAPTKGSRPPAHLEQAALCQRATPTRIPIVLARFNSDQPSETKQSHGGHQIPSLRDPPCLPPGQGESLKAPQKSQQRGFTVSQLLTWRSTSRTHCHGNYVPSTQTSASPPTWSPGPATPFGKQPPHSTLSHVKRP